MPEEPLSTTEFERSLRPTYTPEERAKQQEIFRKAHDFFSKTLGRATFTRDPTGALANIANNPLGLSPKQLSILLQQLGLNLGAAQQLQTGILKQQTAGAPRAVQQSALASSQNKMLGARQRGITQIQAKGIDRQMQAILAQIQVQLERERIKAQKESQLLGSLLGIAVPGGEFLYNQLTGKGGGSSSGLPVDPALFPTIDLGAY